MKGGSFTQKDGKKSAWNNYVSLAYKEFKGTKISLKEIAVMWRKEKGIKEERNKDELFKKEDMPDFNKMTKIELEIIKRNLCNYYGFKPLNGFNRVLINIENWYNMTKHEKVKILKKYWLNGVKNVDINDIRKAINPKKPNRYDDEVI